MIKKFIAVLILLPFLLIKSSGQQVNGLIVSNDNNLTIVKVWGSHQDRGYAIGYLLAEQIIDIYQNFIVPSFGTYLDFAKTIIENPAHFLIEDQYIAEASAMVEGLKEAGYNLNIDYRDILLANSFLDLSNLNVVNLNLRNGCSSLMSWGSATDGTDIEGRSVISRHMDWNDYASIIRNQAMVIHLPSEPNEQPWLFIGFAGQISVLSGINQSGLVVMQHMLADEYSNGSLNKAYEPIWFTLRKSIERADYNEDGQNNVADIINAVESNSNGYADSYIVTGLASANSGYDSLIAIVAEVAPSKPYISIRYNSYPDSIPGDNLYAANSSISRNDAMNLCMRYDSVRTNMGDGTGMSVEKNWNIMLKQSSTCAFGGTGNIQFMQFVPDDKMLKLSVHLNDGTQACENTPLIFDTDELFLTPTVTITIKKNHPFKIYPNPYSTKATVKIDHFIDGLFSIKIFTVGGNAIKEIPIHSNSLEVDDLEPGVYIFGLFNNGNILAREKVIVY